MLQRDIADYARLQLAVAQSEDSIIKLKPLFEAAQCVLTRFRSNYAAASSSTGSDAEFIEAVKATFQAYKHSKARLNEYAQALAQHNEKAQALHDALINFCTKYQLQVNIEPSFFAHLLTQVGKVESLTQRVDQVRYELQCFDDEHPEIAPLNPEDFASSEIDNIEELTQIERDLIRQRDEIQQRLEEPSRYAMTLQSSVDDIPALQEDLENKKELLKRSKQNAATYKAALAYLQEAQESLAHKYLEPLNNALDKNLAQVFGETMSARIDDSLKVKVEVKGAFQESILLSAGQADLVDICLRMSLADVLYPDGDIFMILDDPFINLDDAHMKEAFELLERVATKKQMVYLTCHTSRCPE
jgi:DNA repair exonuclease SbcCD ATPase subunit